MGGPDSGFLDNWTGIDEDVDDVEGLLHKQNRLLEKLLQNQGVTVPSDGPEPYHPNLYVSVPEDSNRLGVPAGETVIDFEQGTVENENLDDTRHSWSSMQDLSQRFGEAEPRLRSLYILADVPVKMRLGTGGTVHELDSCQYYPLSDVEFSQIRLNVSIPYQFALVASTKAQAWETDGVAVHMDRVGEPAAATEDSYTTVAMAPHDLHDDHGQTHAKGTLHTVSFSTVTFIAENISGNGNATDYRVQARQTHGGTWYTVDEKTGVADGDHVIFNVSGAHHHLRLQHRNNTNGDTIQSHAEATGRAP